MTLSKALAACSLPVLPPDRISRDNNGIAVYFFPLAMDRAMVTQFWPLAYCGRLALLPC